MACFPVQDTIEFALSQEEVVINDTVRITAHVNALITGPGSDDGLYAEIRAVMKEFIDTDWRFENVQRSTDETGFERMTLDAVCRVSNRENSRLDARREAVSKPGLKITYTQVDNSISPEMVADAQSRLRRKLIEGIKAEAAIINEAMGATYRVQRIAFLDRADVQSGRLPLLPRRFATMGTGSAALAYRASEESADASPLGNAAKIALRAEVLLAIERPNLAA